MINLENVSFKYPNSKFALKNITLTLSDAQIYAVTGKNGSGKSTLMQIISGLIKQNKGLVTINGLKLKTSLKKNKVKIGIVFQNPDNQIIFNNVYDDICFTLKNYNIPKTEFNKRVDYALNSVNMMQYKHHETISLSAGQKQRIAIANMLAIMPQVLIFDESTSLLDPNSKQELYKLLISLKKQGITIIYTTNILEEIVYADKVLILHNGEIHFFDSLNVIMKNLSIFNEIDLFIPAKLKILSSLYINNKIENFSDETLLLALGVKHD